MSECKVQKLRSLTTWPIIKNQTLYLIVQSARYAIGPAVERASLPIHRNSVVGVIRGYGTIDSDCISTELEQGLSAASLCITDEANVMFSLILANIGRASAHWSVLFMFEVDGLMDQSDEDGV